MKPTYAYVMKPKAHAPGEAEQEQIDRFVAAFMAKKGVPPSGTWRVPGVGYCLFAKTRLHFS